MKQGNFEQKELDWAKEAIINQYIFSFSSTEKIVAQQISLEYEGLPRTFLEEYPERIKNVTLQDCKRIAQKYLRPGQGVLLVLGNHADFDASLLKFGSAKQLKLE